jgi:hypothetical protein
MVKQIITVRLHIAILFTHIKSAIAATMVTVTAIVIKINSYYFPEQHLVFGLPNGDSLYFV